MRYLKSHKSAIWKIKWADIKLGQIFATCGIDQTLKIWQLKFSNNNFNHKLLYSLKDDQINSSINSFDWANWETTLKLAFCTSDNKIGIIYKNFEKFNILIKKQKNNSSSLNSIKWEPLDIFNEKEKKILVTGGCDKNLYFYSYLDGSKNPKDLNLIHKIENAHQNWIRDISWSSNKFLGYNLLATSSEDNLVKIWKIYFGDNSEFKYEEEIIELESPGWKVMWNPNGNLLSVGYTGREGNCFKVFNEDQNGKWICVV